MAPVEKPDDRPPGVEQSSSGERPKPQGELPALPEASEITSALPIIEVTPMVASVDVLAPRIAEKPSLPPAMARIGRYDVLGRIATGGMAEIFLARETAGDVSRLLVVKLVKSELVDNAAFTEMFLGEARVSMRLQHPNICHLYEFGEHARRPYLAMEYVEGVTLVSLVKRNGKVEPALAARIASKVAEALDYAHNATDSRGSPLNITHRDVSPHNVMVGYNGVIKLFDFGIAKAASATVTTSAGQVKGKFAYMAPEQAQGGAVDGRTDVFALGIVLFEMLSARRLFRKDTDFATMHAIVRDPIPDIRQVVPDIPPQLAEIVAKALARDLHERYQSAGDLNEALEDFVAASGVTLSNRRISKKMHSLFALEISQGPTLEAGVDITGSFPAEEPVPAAPAVPALEAPTLDSKRGNSKMIIGAVCVLALAFIVGFGVMALGGEEPAEPVVASEPEPSAEPTGVVEPTAAEESTAGAVAEEVETTETEPTIAEGEAEASAGEGEATSSAEPESSERAAAARMRRGMRASGSMTPRMRYLHDIGF